MATLSDVVAPHWHIFDAPMIDRSTTEYEYVEYQQRDANQMNLPDGGQYTIETRDMDAYLLPHKAVLEVRGRLVVAATNADYAAQEITLTNGGWSLFRSATYEMNNHTVEEINNYLPQASAITNLLAYSDDYGRSSATNMLWYKDTGTAGASSGKYRSQYDAAVVADGTWAAAAHTSRDEFRAALALAAPQLDNPDYNQGFALRKAVTTGAKDTCLFLPLSQIFGSHKDIDTVFIGVKHTYQFTRENAANYIVRANGVDPGKFVIKHMSLWMPKVTPSLPIAAAIEQKLVSGAMRQLYFEQVRIYRQSYQQTEISSTWRVTTNSSEQLPNYIFVAFQLQDKYGDQETNPVVFDAGTLSRISCGINSKRFPDRELEVSFDAASRNYGRAYMMFQEAISKYNDTDSGSQVSVEDYASLFPIIAFNVGHHKDRLRGSSADIELRWSLSGNFGGHYHVYALVFSDRYMQLNGLNGKMGVVV